MHSIVPVAFSFYYNAPIVTNTTINTISITGIDEIQNTDLIIYPNPAKDQFMVCSPLLKNMNATISMSDNTGNTIYKINNSKNEKIIVNTKDFATGIYFVHIQAENISETRKVVIIR